MRLLQVIIAIPVGLAALAALTASFFWPGDLSLFFLPWTAFGALILFGVAWIVSARIIAGAAAFLLTVSVTMMAAIWSPPAEWPEPQQPLRITTFNAFIGNADPAALEAYLRAEMPDVVVLEETFGDFRTEVLRRVGDVYPYVVDTGDRSELVLISQHPIVESVTLENDRGTGLSGSMMRTEIEAPAGGIVVYSVHAPTPRFGVGIWKRRNATLDDLADAVAAEPAGSAIIVVGDFNTPSWSPFFADLLQRSGLSDTSGRFVPLATRVIDRNILPGGFGAPVDHILVSDNIAWRPIEAGPLIGSDHRPMTAELALPFSLRR